MGLPAALTAHKNKDFKKAVFHYERAYKQNERQPILFQNYGALLRELGHVDRAHKVYSAGLQYHPSHRGIRLNFANLIRRDRPVKAFEIHLSLLQEKILSNEQKDLNVKDIIPVVELLELMGYNHWAYSINKWSLNYITPDPSFLLLLFKVASSPQLSTLFADGKANKLIASLDLSVKEFSVLDQAEYYFTLATYQLLKNNTDDAMKEFLRARKLLTSHQNLTADDKDKADKLNNRHIGIWVAPY